MSSPNDKPGSSAGHPGTGERQPLRTLGEFEIYREIGRGGMGTVYEARQRSLSRTVALKVLDGQISASQVAVARFQREAQAAAKLNHPHIVPIYAQGVEGGTYFYAMELVDGPSVNALIGEVRAVFAADTARIDLDETVVVPRAKQPAIPPVETVAVARSGESEFMDDSNVALAPRGEVGLTADYFHDVVRHIADVADALAYAHDQGVIHRDIKPHNLLLGKDGRLRISDFGLARLAEQPGVTMTGEMIGSPLYMSPEQITGAAGEIDHRTDIYSLGATLYEWLTLKPPYPGETRERVISLIMSTEPLPARTHNERISVELETVCSKALERDPARRYQSAAEFRDDLVRYLEKRPIKARRAGVVARVVKTLRRHQIAAVVGVALLAGAALLTALFSQRTQVRSQTLAAAEAQDQAAEAQDQAAEILEILGQALPYGLELTAVLRGAEAVQGIVGGPRGSGASGAEDDSGSPQPPPKASVGTPSSIASRTAREFYRAIMPPDWLFAASSFEPSAANANDPTLAMLREAETLWSEGELNRARGLLDAYLATRPNYFAARQMHAALCAEMGLYEELLEDASVMVRLDSQSWHAYVWRGVAHLLMDKLDNAMTDLAWAAEMDRRSPWAKVLLGLAMIRTGRAVGAVLEFEDALREDPEMVLARLGRASAYYVDGRFVEGIEDATAVLAHEQDNADALTIRGDCHASLAAYQAAVVDYTAAMEIVGKTPALGLRYLSVLAQLQQLSKARDADSSKTQPATTTKTSAEDSTSDATVPPLLDWLSNLTRP